MWELDFMIDPQYEFSEMKWCVCEKGGICKFET